MNEGDVVLALLPQADWDLKYRPAILLRRMPPFNDVLVCGVSSQLQHETPDFDETIGPGDADYAQSGLKTASLIRLGFLVVLPTSDIAGRLGSISPERHRRLLVRLCDYLRPDESA